MIRNLLSTIMLVCAIGLYAQPANDICDNAQSIVMGGPDICIPTQGNNFGATDSDIVPGCALYQGGETWFTVVVPSTGVAIIETSADTTGNIDTGMAVYTGSCSDLELLDCNDDGGEGLYSRVELTCLSPGTQLFIAVWEYGGDTEGYFNVCAFQPPSNCEPLSGLSLNPLSFTEAEISWSTLNSGNPFTVEYGIDGFTPGSGATITGVVCIDGPPVNLMGLIQNTTYDVYVYEDCSGMNTDTLTGTFTTPPICQVPSGLTADSVSSNYISLTWDSPNVGSTYYVEYGPEGFSQGSGTIINGVTGTDGPPIEVSGLDTLTVYDFYLWDDCNGVNISDTTSITVVTTPGPLTNDDCQSPIFLTVAGPADCQPTLGWNNGATDSGITPTCANYQGGDVWYAFVAPAGGEVFIETSGTTTGFADGGLALYSGTCDGGLTQVECNDDGGDGLFSLIEATGLTPGETYYVAVWEYGNNAVGTFNICVYLPPTCPTPNTFSFFASSIFSTEAYIEWTVENPGATYIIEYGPDGFTPGTGSIATGIIGTDGPPALLTGLDPETTYDYYFQGVCGPGDSTEVVGPNGFTTLETCPTVQDFELDILNAGVDFITLTWPSYNPGATIIIEYGETGFEPGTGNQITGVNGVDGPPFTIPGLVLGTEYDFYLQEVCNVNDSTGLTGPSTFETNSVFPPANDTLCNAIELIVNADFALHSSSGATNAIAVNGEVEGSCFGGGNPLESVWFQFTAPESGEVTVSTDLANTELHDTHIAIYELTGGDCTDLTGLTEIGCDEDGGEEEPSGFTSVAELSDLTAGENYFIQVDGWDGDDGEFGIRVFENTVSIEEHISDGFNLFPNPSAGQVTLTAGTLSGLVNIEVMDMNGRLTYIERALMEATRPVILDLNDLDAGLYLIRIQNDEGFSMKRLVIE